MTRLIETQKPSVKGGKKMSVERKKQLLYEYHIQYIFPETKLKYKVTSKKMTRFSNKKREKYKYNNFWCVSFPSSCNVGIYQFPYFIICEQSQC